MIRKGNLTFLYKRLKLLVRFFFHYSGHGGRVADTCSDEDDGHDETIYPLDYEQYEGASGQIRDDVEYCLKNIC